MVSNGPVVLNEYSSLRCRSGRAGGAGADALAAGQAFSDRPPNPQPFELGGASSQPVEMARRINGTLHQ
jgi:hypothetical protein